jgi:DNA-binding NtrC family response regulator/tetratricopeptide (TPR) repeat protein
MGGMVSVERTLLGESAQIARVRDQLSRLLARQTGAGRRLPPILIQGETGTGKGLVAQVLHRTGPRADAAFVDVNCAAIPDSLLEAELFGFERGAFTDARQPKAGLLQTAHRGTIFLDEIGLMPEALQGKLLKAIEERLVRRLGSTRSEPVDAWVLAATSEDLQAAMRARRFREDLFHRLAVVTLLLPPLRDRGADIVLLARHYLSRACRDYGVPQKALDPSAEAALLEYPWPGNVRELANVMERVSLLLDASTVTGVSLGLPSQAATAGVSSLPDTALTSGSAAGGVDDQLADLERRRIHEALVAVGWNISRAAARLGLARNTLRYRMERHGLAAEGPLPIKRRVRTSVASSSAQDLVSPSTVAADSRVEWQRRRITLLHVALTGESMEGDRSRAIDELAAKSVSFGGRVVERGADGLLVAFGMEPVENAPGHAAHTALAMRHAIRTLPLARPFGVVPAIAIHTGELLVGKLADRVELETDSRRAAQDVLTELFACTPQEAIVASAETVPFLDRSFNLQRIAGVTCGGKPVWRLLGLIDSGRHATPFVARARELTLLEDLFAQARSGRGQAVLIVGEPGIGKSRLLQELRHRTRGHAGWSEGHALSFGRSLPFLPVIDLIRHFFHIEDADTDATIIGKIEAGVMSYGSELHPTQPFLRYLLSVDPDDAAVTTMDPKLRRAGMFDAIRQLLLATARRQPQIVVLEDAHWMDQVTAEFLALFADSVVSDRILLIVTQRPGFSLPFGDETFQTRLTLPRLSEAETSQVAASLLGAPVVSTDLLQLIDSKTEGNPFFIEEVVRSLQESGVVERRGDEATVARPTDTIVVPNTVQDVILARLERLDSAPRHLLHVAAVIGREFQGRVLERVAGAESIDDQLEALRSADLIQKKRVWPEVVHVFKHALTHDVAYHSQDESQRQALHARIGEAIEEIHAGRLAEHYGVLAHHFTRAGQWSKALGYLLEAARQAERGFATREALSLYDEAKRAAEQLGGGIGDPATLITIHESKARLYFVTSDFERSAAEGERILPLARLRGDRVKESEALATIAWASTWRRDLEGAVRVAREAIAVAEPAGAVAVEGRANFIIGFVRGVSGVLEESQGALENALRLTSAAGDAVHRSLALSTAGLLRNWEGDYETAVRLQNEGLALARERGLLVPLLFSAFLRGLTLTGKGDYDEAFGTFQEGLRLAERVGDEAIHHRLLNCLGWLYAELGDLDRAYALNTTSAQIGRRRRDPGTQPNAEINLGDILLARGDLAAAQDRYEGVYRYWKDPATSLWMRFRYSIRLFASMGELALARCDLGAARAHSAQCLELATRTGSRKNLVKGHRLAGAVAGAAREWDRAEDHLRTALRLGEGLGNPAQLWKTELALGRLLGEAGRVDDARDAYVRAMATMQRVRDGLRHDELRSAFDTSFDVQHVRALVANHA